VSARRAAQILDFDFINLAKAMSAKAIREVLARNLSPPSSLRKQLLFYTLSCALGSATQGLVAQGWRDARFARREEREY